MSYPYKPQRLINEKEKSEWMNERMNKGYSFRYLKNDYHINIGIVCIETKEEFDFIYQEDDRNES